MLIVFTVCKLWSALVSKQYWPVPLTSPSVHKQTFYYGSFPNRAGTQVSCTLGDFLMYLGSLFVCFGPLWIIYFRKGSLVVYFWPYYAYNKLCKGHYTSAAIRKEFKNCNGRFHQSRGRGFPPPVFF